MEHINKGKKAGKQPRGRREKGRKGPQGSHVGGGANQRGKIARGAKGKTLGGEVKKGFVEGES